MRGDALLTPVNRTNRLRSDWAPVTTVLPAAYRQPSQQSMRADAAEAFVAMADAARAAGVNIVCLSGYRSFATQCTLFANYAASHGCDEANTFSAHAGHSEHQLGTVCDVALASSSSSFIVPGGPADTWLRAHAREHGFANSYPNDDAALNDGYIHEPWHYRYIGIGAATTLKQREASLASGRRLSVPVFIATLSAEEIAELEGGDALPPPPPPPPDPTAAPANACAGADGVTGWFCGVSLGREADTNLYLCRIDPNTGSMITSSTMGCPNDCEAVPPGVPDRCR
jgi:LAS superfamily LD-carboxypeptidase LdcB